MFYCFFSYDLKIIQVYESFKITGNALSIKTKHILYLIL